MRGNKWFIITAAVIVALMPVAIYLAQVTSRENRAALEVEASLRSAAMALNTISVACERYRMEYHQDQDDDGRGEYGPLGLVTDAGYLDERFARIDDQTLQYDGYRFIALIADDVEQAESAQVLIAIAGNPNQRSLAMTSSGDIHIAPADWVADVNNPTTPQDWPLWN